MSQKLLLIVDDNVTWREVLGASFRHHGFRTRLAADGHEAMAAAQAEPPDLIILDLALPGMDGLAFLRAVRADEVLAGVPVIVATARSDAGTAGQTAALGVRHYMVKAGHSMAELLDAVRQSLSPDVG